MMKILKLVLVCSLISIYGVTKAQYAPGDKVKDFSLRSSNSDKMISLAGSGDNIKGAIVVFTCNHCPFSQAYESRIIDLHNKYASKGFPVVAINSNDPAVVPEDNFEAMVALAAEKKYPFQYIYDETQEVARQFGAARTPHVFVLEKKENEFYVRYIGAIDDNADDAKAVTKKYTEDAVNSLLANKAVAVNTTKAIGCTIKWKQ